MAGCWVIGRVCETEIVARNETVITKTLFIVADIVYQSPWVCHWLAVCNLYSDDNELKAQL